MELSVAIAIKVLREHFPSKRNREIKFELFQFREAYQRAKEHLDGYYARLKTVTLNLRICYRVRLKVKSYRNAKWQKLRDEGLCRVSYSLKISNDNHRKGTVLPRAKKATCEATPN